MSPRITDGKLPEDVLSRIKSMFPSEMMLPEFVPLPSAKQTEYFSGLKRGVINQLILPTKSNDYNPPVRSLSLRKKGNAKGKRLVVLSSLLDYLRSLQAEQSSESVLKTKF